jgi:hypothetical protein
LTVQRERLDWPKDYSVENRTPTEATKALDNFPLSGTFAGMSRSFSEIAEDALGLPQNERLKLARALLECAGASKEEFEAEAAWEAEIVRRVHLVDTGQAKGRLFADVLRDVDGILGSSPCWARRI